MVRACYLTVGGKETLLVSIVLPLLDENKNFLGIVGADFTIDRFQQNIASLNPDQGYAMLITSEGQIAAHGSKPELAHEGAVIPSEMKTVIQRIQSGESQFYATDPEVGEELFIAEPARLQGTDSNWYLVSALPKSHILQPFYDSLNWSILIAVLAVLLLAGVVTYTIVSIVRQLNQVNIVAGQLAGGDLTQKLPVRSKDEFGIMAGHMNQMMDTLRHTISVISEHALSVGSTSQQLTAGAEETGKAAELIALTGVELADKAGKQVQELQESSRSMNEISAGSEELQRPPPMYPIHRELWPNEQPSELIRFSPLCVWSIGHFFCADVDDRTGEFPPTFGRDWPYYRHDHGS